MINMSYIGRQDDINLAELYIVDFNKPGISTKLNSQLIPDGGVSRFVISENSQKVVYVADQEMALKRYVAEQELLLKEKQMELEYRVKSNDLVNEIQMKADKMLSAIDIKIEKARAAGVNVDRKEPKKKKTARFIDDNTVEIEEV